MKKLKIFSVIMLLFVFSGYSYDTNLPDNTLLKYYSALLTLNLNSCNGIVQSYLSSFKGT